MNATRRDLARQRVGKVELHLPAAVAAADLERLVSGVRRVLELRVSDPSIVSRPLMRPPTS